MAEQDKNLAEKLTPEPRCSCESPSPGTEGRCMNCYLPKRGSETPEERQRRLKTPRNLQAELAKAEAHIRALEQQVARETLEARRQEAGVHGGTMSDKIRELAEEIWQHSVAFRRDLAISTIEADLVRGLKPLLDAASSIAHCCSRETCPTRQSIYRLADEVQDWNRP